MPDESGPSETRGRRASIVTLIWFALAIAVVTLAIRYLFFNPYPERERRRTVSCRSNLKLVGLSIGMYQADYEGQMPPDLTTLVLEDYLKIGVDKEVAKQNVPIWSVLSCPSRGKEWLASGDIDGTSSYCYAQLKNPQATQKLEDAPIMWDKVALHNGGVNVLFADLQPRWETLQDSRARIERYADLYVKPPALPVEERE